MGVDRLRDYMTTAKQREFDYDFLKGAHTYETWEEVEIGRQYEAKQTFLVTEEDILAYNRGVSETEPLVVDPESARKSAPTSQICQHPLFLVQIAFYCIEKGPCNWIRTPGARNPGQRMDFFEPFRPGEVITMRETAADKWIRRDKHYLQYKLDFHNQDEVLKATWWLTLILPPNREAIMRLVNAT